LWCCNLMRFTILIFYLIFWGFSIELLRMQSHEVNQLDDNTLVGFSQLINQFVQHSFQFLNKFQYSCEEKLQILARDIKRLEMSLVVLESRLNYVPCLKQTKELDQYTTFFLQPEDGLEEYHTNFNGLPSELILRIASFLPG